MNITSTLLTQLGQATGLGDPGPEDNLLKVPPTMVPIISIPFVQLPKVGAGSTPNSSFQGYFFNSQTNVAAPVTITLLTLSPGLWDLNVWTQIAFNWSTAAAGNQDLILGMQDGSNVNEILSLTAFVTTSTITDLQKRRYLIAKPTTLVYVFGISGVGQTTSISSVIRGERLL